MIKTVLFSMLLIISCFKAQGQWNKVYQFNPSGGFNSINGAVVLFTDSIHGHAFLYYWFSPSSGGDTFYRSSADYGDSWSGEVGFSAHQNDAPVGAYNHGNDTMYVFLNNVGGTYKYTFDGGANWNKTYVGGLNNVFDFHMLDGQNGYAITTQGLVKKIEPDSCYTLFNTYSTFNIYGPSKIHFPTSKTGYLVIRDYPYGDFLLQSTDYGSTWSTQYVDSAASPRFRDLYFLNDSVGLVVTDTEIIKTIDSGQTFMAVQAPLNNYTINDITFINDSTGYCVGDNSIFWVTKDYGSTWQTGPAYFGNGWKLQMFGLDFGYILTTNYSLFKLAPSGFSPEVNLSDLKVYPNPTSRSFTIEFEDFQEEVSLEVYSSIGDLILQVFEANTNKIRLNVNSPSGMYIIRVHFGDGTSKMVKILKT